MKVNKMVRIRVGPLPNLRQVVETEGRNDGYDQV